MAHECFERFEADVRARGSACDVEALCVQLQRAAVQCGFERAVLLVKFPTPFVHPGCIALEAGRSLWTGTIRDLHVAPYLLSLRESLGAVDMVSWQWPRGVQDPDVETCFGVTYATTASRGRLYGLSFVSKNMESTLFEPAKVSVCLRLLVDWASRHCAEFCSALPDDLELTVREKEILRWTADGKCTNDVARILGISGNTVNYHVQKLLGKTGCINKLQAVAYAVAHRLI
jgi:DNA-binding CsgD family transcriptional regulator